MLLNSSTFIHIVFLCFLCVLTACSSGSKTLAPIIDHGSGDGGGSAGAHIIKYGDTAYNIAKRYNVPLRDLLDRNNMSPPYNLKTGRRLYLPPPNIYKVQTGDTLYGVSRIFDVSVTEIARQNSLQSPYTLKPGQTLNLPYAGRGNSQAKVRQSARTKTPQTRQTPARFQAPKRASSRFQWPVNGRVISRYGPKKGGLHNDGINIAMPRGAPVRVSENGVVLYSGDVLQGYGNLVLVRHDGGWVTAYAHLDRILVKKGQTLKVGDTLGTVGSTGQVDTPQLHFEIRKGSKALNPQKYLSTNS